MRAEYALQLVVDHSGPGFSSERRGVGLMNARGRLYALYGGAAVTITIPRPEAA